MTIEKEEILIQLTDIFRELVFISGKEINYTDNIRTDLGIDSVDMVDLIVKIEDFYGISFTDSEFNRIKTMNDLIEKIQEKTNGK